jgi:15-cis-phytoene synthase
MRQEQIDEAYDYCRRVVQRASKTFYWGSLFLPPPKRRAIWAVYAFCRVVDDIVDEEYEAAVMRPGHLRGARQPEEELDYWCSAIERVYHSGGIGDGPIQLAWSDMITRYPVPLSPLLDLVQGVKMDLTQQHYETFAELYLYCYRVAGAVGLLTSPIFGYHHEDALAHAVDLGVALQLTNILRDVGEDARRGRVYLPRDEMRHFGYSEAELMSGVINDAFRELVHFQMGRADEYYQRSQPGIAMLSADCRMAVRLSSTLYRHILDRIRLNNCNVFTKRASVPLQTKLAAVPQYWFMQQLEMRAK